MTSEETKADGKTRKYTDLRSYDGKEVPIDYNPGVSAISERIDASSHRTIFKKDGKQVAVVESVVSADGKTMTNTLRGTDSKGNSFERVMVYEKQ